MVRSIWQGALVVTLAFVGLAWSQSARTGNGGATPAATMTVHENDKDLPCRVVKSWEQPNGAKAYQLQIIASGEMLTLVEDGPATTYQGKSGRMKALSMRIFHWGNRRTPPPGVPVPPERILSDQETGKPIILSESNVKLISLTPDPVLPPGCKMCSPPTTVPGGNLACNTCPGGPCPNGQCSPSSGAVQNPGTGTFSYSQMPTGRKPGSGSAITEVAATQTSDPGSNPPATQGTLPSARGDHGTKPGAIVVAQGTSAPGSQTIPAQGTSTPGSQTVPEQGTRPAGKGMLPSVSSVSNPTPGPGSQQVIVQGTGPVQKTGSFIPDQIVPAQSPGQQPATLAGQAGSLGQTNVGTQTTAGNKANQTTSKPPTLAEKVKNIFHRQEQEPASGTQKTATSGANTVVAPKTAASGTTAAPSGTNRSTLANTQPLNMSGTPTTLPTAQQVKTVAANQPSATAVSSNTAPASKDTKAAEKKSAWERIWGKPLFAKTKQPGQTTVAPTPNGTGPAVPTAKPQPSGTVVVAQGTPSAQGFPAPTTKVVAGPGGQIVTVPATGAANSPATLVDVTPTVVPPAPPVTTSNLVPGGPTKIPQAVAQGKVAMPPASYTATDKQIDPLLNPEQIRSSRVQAKVGTLPPPPPTAYGPAKTTGQAQPGMSGGLNQVPPLPMGSGSVMAAQNGLPIPYHYMPVPLVTVPNPLRNPGPPPPDVPAPPQPTAFVNAFSPGRTTPKPGDGQQNAMPPNVTMGPYGPLPDPRMMNYPPQLVAQGMPYPGMNPYLMPYMGPTGPGMMPQIPPVTPMGMQRPIAQVNYPSNYQGPMPPNPMIGSNMPTMPYPQPMPTAMPMPRYGNPAMDRPGLAPTAQGTGSITHLLGQLRDSISPAEREMAALNLSNQDWRGHPEIVQVLVTSARQDPAAMVRAGCIHSLAVQNINTEPVLTALKALKNDPDPRVRLEADQALTRLSGTEAPATMPALQPISHRP